jgi:integrase
MAQHGFVFRKGRSWFLRYREDVPVNGQMVRKQKCVKLADYSDRYRCASDLDELVAEKMTGVRAAAKCPHASDSFIEYVENVYLPFILRSKKASTYDGYKTHFERYIKPRVGKYSLRDFTISLVSSLLDDICAMHRLNTETIGKVRSILSGIFTYAMAKGNFPGKSASDNPASKAMIPESASEPRETVAASREQVKAILAALKDMPLERAAVAIVAMLGVRPSEARGLKWSDWNRAKDQVQVSRSVWHAIESTTKTPQSVRLLAVSAELRDVLLTLWKKQNSPLDGYILAGPRSRGPIVLDNMAKRTIRARLDEVNLTEKSNLTWPGWYALRRFHGTAVRAESTLETTSRALGNSKGVADKHYVKPTEVLPDVRKAVNDAVSGLTDVQRECN